MQHASAEHYEANAAMYRRMAQTAEDNLQPSLALQFRQMAELCDKIAAQVRNG